MAHSSYYHSLAPFRRLFESALPILTYHKLGPRPSRVRLKGLYVSQSLFARQMAELRAAHFKSISLDAAGENPPERSVVLTFDDGFSNVLRYGAPLLAENGFRAIEFLVADLIGKTNEWEQREGETSEPLMDAAQVRDWLAAGHEIGSHTLTHPHLNQIPMAEAREEIFASKKKLEDLFGRPVHHFCYPFGDWNEAVRDLVIEAGYHTAVTTNAGVNPPGQNAHSLKRFTARYPSKSLSQIWARVRMRFTN